MQNQVCLRTCSPFPPIDVLQVRAMRSLLKPFRVKIKSIEMLQLLLVSMFLSLAITARIHTQVSGRDERVHVGQLSTWPNWQHSCSLSYKLTHSPRPFNSFSNSPLFLHTDFWRKDVTTIKVRGCCFPGNSTRSTQSPLELACYVPRYYHPSLRGNKLWQQLNILWNEYVHNSRMNQ